MQKSRTEIKCAVNGYPLHALPEAAYIAECIFLISVQLLSISLDVL